MPYLEWAVFLYWDRLTEQFCLTLCWSKELNHVMLLFITSLKMFTILIICLAYLRWLSLIILTVLRWLKSEYISSCLLHCWPFLALINSYKWLNIRYCHIDLWVYQRLCKDVLFIIEGLVTRPHRAEAISFFLKMETEFQIIDSVQENTNNTIQQRVEDSDLSQFTAGHQQRRPNKQVRRDNNRIL